MLWGNLTWGMALMRAEGFLLHDQGQTKKQMAEDRLAEVMEECSYDKICCALLMNHRKVGHVAQPVQAQPAGGGPG